MTNPAAPDASPSPTAKMPVTRPRRARELQDGLNHYLYHPLAWQLARLLAKTPLTPNMVSVIGGCFVIAAGYVYAQPAIAGHGWPWPALIGMLLHMTWHVVDGADGDLARLTGRVSPIGELVDGVCDYTSHIVLYLTLGWIMSPALGWMAWAAVVLAGAAHIVQANHVEVQRRQYQWWVYGTPWLRNTHAADSATGKSGIGGIVTGYLELASGMTPDALKIDAAVEAALGDPARLDAIRAVVKPEALPLLRFLRLLGPNPRAIILGLSMLAGSPIWYCLIYMVLMNALLVVSVRRHNAMARRVVAQIEAASHSKR